MKSGQDIKWEKYYSEYKNGGLVVRFIECINRGYFTSMFMKELYKIAGKKSGLYILEPGCGSALMSSYLAESNKVVVLDSSKNALQVARENFDKNDVKGEFILGDLRHMPFQDDCFDVVWNQGVMEHFKNPVPAMKEMLRVVKTGGYIAIFVPAFLSPLHFIYLLLKLFNLKKLWPFDEQDFFTGKSFRKFMENAGYRNIKVKRLWLKSVGFSQVGYCQKLHAR